MLREVRPRQWTKNGLLFVALAFTLNLQQPELLVRAIAAFVCFCALSRPRMRLDGLTLPGTGPPFPFPSPSRHSLMAHEGHDFGGIASFRNG